MKKALKWIGIIVAVLIVIVLVLPFLINVNAFRPRIESELTNALGRKVTVGNLSLSLWSGSLAADNIAIADDPAFGNAPFVKADALNVGVNVIPLIMSKTLEIREITLTRPQVTLLRTPAGKWNFSTLGNQAGAPGTAPAATQTDASSKPGPSNPNQNKAAPGKQTEPASAPSPEQKSSSEQGLEQNLSVGKLNIRSGQISVADTNAPGKPRIYKNVDVSVKDFSFSSQFPFELTGDLPGGGNVKLDGTGGAINRADTSLTPLQAKISVNQLDLAKSGFIDPSSGFSGLVNFAGTVQSDGNQARSAGSATADKLKLSPKGTPAQSAISMKYATVYELQKQTGQLTQGDVSVGKASAKLSGTYDLRGSAPVLNMKLNADNMPVNDLQTLLPALGVTLPSGSSLQGGTLSADLTISGPVTQMVIAGPVKLANTKLAGFDMGSKMSAISALTGAKTGPDTSIQNFSSNVRYSPSGIQTENVNLVLPALGTVTGSGTVSPQNALDYKMKASLNGSVVSGASKLAGLSGNGATIPFFIQGTASDPKFVPDVKGMVGSQLSNQLSNRLGSQVPGGQNAQGAVKALGGLFGKKKKQ
ncbi:MAG TPA: AsmA family protein [Terriglobales bacterium]|jgi:AsmA protein|nr:AsmA family protein [Terriglobales bacterium]